MGNQEHLSTEELSLLLDGALDAARGRRLESHAADCARCREETEALRSLECLVAEPEPLPSGLLQRTLEIPERHGPRPALAPLLRWAPLTAMAAAALLLVLVRLRDEGRRVTVADGTPRPGSFAAEAPVELGERVRYALRRGDADAEHFLDELGERALPALHRLARARDADTARAAIVRLGHLAHRASLPALREALQRDDRRIEAIDALARVGDVRAVGVLEAWLGDLDVGALALEVVVGLGGDEAARALERRLAVETDADRRRALVAALGQVDGGVGVRALLGLLDDPDLSPSAWAALEANESAVRASLLRFARGPREDVARAALAVLEHLAPPEAVDGLRPLLASRTHRGAAARALARIDTPAAATALFDALPAPEVRAAFRHAGTGIERWLVRRLRRDDGPARVRIVDLLGRCGRARAVVALEGLGADPALAPLALEALAAIRSDTAIAALGRMAARPALRRPAIDALAATHASAAVPVLMRLGLRDPALHAPVLRALARIDRPEAVEAIVRLDGRPRTRRAVTRTLRGMNPETVVSALTSLLEGDLAPTARRALDAVGRARPRASSRGALIQ